MSEDEALAPGVWRRGALIGSLLLVRSGTVLPPVCVDCGAPCSGEPLIETHKALKAASAARLVKSFARGPFTALFGNKADVGSFLCVSDIERRQRNRRIALAFALALPVIGVALTALVETLSHWVCLGLFFSWIIALGMLGKRKQIEAYAIEPDGLAMFTGVDSRFFEQVRNTR